MEAVLDTSEWETFLSALSGRYRQASDYLKLAVETKGRQDVLEHFSNQTGPMGAWTPRAASTQRAYANYASGRWKAHGHQSKYNPTNLILILTGRLRQSILPSSSEGGVRVLDRTSVMLFSAVEYSRAHDRGVPGRLPQREFMWLSDKGKEVVSQVFLSALMEGL